MSFREDYEYHVMNCATGRLTYSCSTEKEALAKANSYAGYSDTAYIILQRVAAVYSVKTVQVEPYPTKQIGG